MKYYKVTDQFACSMMVSKTNEVKYELGKWVHRRPLHGPLCVFSDLGEARMWDHRGNRIFECEIQPSKDTRVWHHDDEDGVWGTVGLERLPPWTVLADSVKLTREIHF